MSKIPAREQAANRILLKFSNDLNFQLKKTTPLPFARWYGSHPIEAYLRYQYGIPPGSDQGEFLLCLANVIVAEECRRKGLFTLLLDGMLRLANDHGMYLKVESIQNNIVTQACAQRGMVPEEQSRGCGIYNYWTVR